MYRLLIDHFAEIIELFQQDLNNPVFTLIAIELKIINMQEKCKT